MLTAGEVTRPRAGNIILSCDVNNDGYGDVILSDGMHTDGHNQLLSFQRADSNADGNSPNYKTKDGDLHDINIEGIDLDYYIFIQFRYFIGELDLL